MVDYGLCEVQTQKQMKQHVPRYLTRDELVAIDPSLRDVLQHWVGTEDQDTGEGQPSFPETQEMAVARYCKTKLCAKQASATKHSFHSHKFYYTTNSIL